MKYSILLVIHNHADLTRLCLDSIYRYSNAGDFELLVLDNASTDGTRDMLRGELERRDNLRVFFNKTNQGFMSPMNYLASEAKGEFLVILNNDLQVCGDWLERMRAAFDSDSAIALVGLSQNCGEIGPDGTGQPVKHRLEYIEASCMMMPKSVYAKHGLFDDKYYSFGYYEDSDLSLRLRERGFKIATINLPIIHRRASTMRHLTIDIDGIRARNKSLFQKRWASYLRKRNFEKRVLFKRSAAVGDVIMATPVIEAYKQRYPFASITFATRYPWVLENNPYLDRIVDVNAGIPTPGQFDEFYDLDLAYERRPEINVVKAYAAEVGISVNGNQPRLYVAKPNGKDGKLAVIHAERIPGWPGRNAPLECYRAAVPFLVKCGFRVIEVGSSVSLINGTAYHKTTFPELCALIASASIFVGQDSAPFHVAQAYGVPAVVPFGAVKPEYRDCSGKVFPVTVEGIKCLGCHHIQAAPRIKQECLRPKPLCMMGITGEMMEKQIALALKGVIHA
jgi:GT2 family glycosyltransferase